MTDSRFFEVLDWTELLTRLAAETQSPAGRARCLELPLAANAGEASRRMAAVAELAALLRAGESLPSLAAPEIEAALVAAEKGIVLGADELRPIAVSVAAAEAARRAFVGTPASSRVPTPEVADLAQKLDPPRGLAQTIGETFDASGEMVSDGASPELSRLRGERIGLAERARGAIEALMRSEEYGNVLQDQFFTVRAERYVLPLKASAKSLGLGIVHDTSRTGETVFVEPTALVGANNRLKVIELDIRRESRRILEALTADVAAVAPALRASAATLAALDVVAASARLAVGYGGNAIEIVDDSVVDLRQARHPLLALAQAEAGRAGQVVANDVALGGPAAALLIVSGPNAGGKTVLMKTVGLAALMARAGLLVPAEHGSRIGLFTARVRAAIGDRQSVLGALSTFSGHLREPGRDPERAQRRSDAGAARRADGRHQPRTGRGAGARHRRDAGRAAGAGDDHHPLRQPQGAGRGRRAFRQRGHGVRPGTAARHVPAGGRRPGARLRLRHRGADGAPGPAARIGHARWPAAPASGSKTAIARLEAREAALARDAQRLAEAEAAARATAEAQNEAALALARREREPLGHRSREAVEAAIAEARAEIRGVVRRAQDAGTSRAAEADAKSWVGWARRRWPSSRPGTELARAGVRGAARRSARACGSRAVGANGVVAQPPDARGRARVTVGKMTIEIRRRRAAAASPPRRAGPRAQPPLPPLARATRAGAEEALALVSQLGSPTVDLRGQTGDDALAQVEAALDRAALTGQSHLVVVHGHGTGALRKRVRAYLDESAYVARWAPGSARQGGDGVSIVELR